MSADVACVTSLRNCSIFVWCSVGIDLIGAVVLLIGLAVFTCEICLNLCTNTDPVSDFDGLHIFADFDRLTNYFMTNAQWQWNFSPTTSDGVNIGTADTAGWSVLVSLEA